MSCIQRPYRPVRAASYCGQAIDRSIDRASGRDRLKVGRTRPSRASRARDGRRELRKEKNTIISLTEGRLLYSSSIPARQEAQEQVAGIPE